MELMMRPCLLPPMNFQIQMGSEEVIISSLDTVIFEHLVLTA